MFVGRAFHVTQFVLEGVQILNAAQNGTSLNSGGKAAQRALRLSVCFSTELSLATLMRRLQSYFCFASTAGPSSPVLRTTTRDAIAAQTRSALPWSFTLQPRLHLGVTRSANHKGLHCATALLPLHTSKCGR